MSWFAREPEILPVRDPSLGNFFQEDLEDDAVFARNTMALGYLGNRLCQFLEQQ